MALAKADSIDLSRYILAKCGKMPHLKLQKLVYYAEAYHLAYFEAPLIDDDFEAWMHGPVSPKVWHFFKDLDAPVYNSIEIDAENAKAAIAKLDSIISEDQIDLLKDVLDGYGKESAYHLECFTHQEKPWIDARKGYSPDSKCSVKISKQTMAEFYRALMLKAADGN